MKLKRPVKVYKQWQWWFAWFPVNTPEFRWVWMERVLRARHVREPYGDSFTYLTKLEAVKNRLRVTNVGAEVDFDHVSTPYKYDHQILPIPYPPQPAINMGKLTTLSGGSNVGQSSQSKKVP